MTREELLREARKMRAAVREHRDATGHDLCWHWPDLWALLPDTTERKLTVPDWPHFMRGCIHYRSSLDRQLADADRTQEEFSR
ncbi:MAG: hypothetical protein KI785_10095 [Devosiaceae bacterium]|nr:hypothetical protein [Devosiaceae bacterium MH13]